MTGGALARAHPIATGTIFAVGIPGECFEWQVFRVDNCLFMFCLGWAKFLGNQGLIAVLDGFACLNLLIPHAISWPIKTQ